MATKRSASTKAGQEAPVSEKPSKEHTKKSSRDNPPAWLKTVMWVLQILVIIAAVLVVHILYEVVYKGNSDYDPVRTGLEHVTRLWAIATAPAPRQFTKEELAKYDGNDPALPVYLAFKGRVYDVSRKRHIYGKGGDYGFFSGKDATRAFATGCFKEECLIDDITGLDEKELQEIDRWVSFYEKEYIYVGDLKKE